MKVGDRLRPDEIPPHAHERVCDDVHHALQSVVTQGSEFVINDTEWFWVNPQGQLRPTVVNSAPFISKKFQDTLRTRGWKTEATIEGQRIDGYIELPIDPGYQLDRDTFLDLFILAAREKREERLDRLCAVLYRRYVVRRCHNILVIPKHHHHLFIRAAETPLLRIGLEFETGNISSSFRALSKLESLYVEGAIDAAVFITSLDKESTAARIWPQSNRNGSFEELENRDYLRNFTAPLWEFSFAPDRISINAPYLAKDGSTFLPKDLSKEVMIKGRRFSVYKSVDGKEILRSTASP